VQPGQFRDIRGDGVASVAASEVSGSAAWARVPLETLASNLFDRVAAAVLVVNLEGVVLYASPYCEYLYGRAPEEMIGHNAIDFTAGPITDELRLEIAQTLLSGKSWEGDFAVRRGDGAIVEVHAIDAPVFDERGSMTAVVTVAFDSTREARSERQLRRLMAVVQILRDVGETLVNRLDATRVMQTVTSAARRLTDAVAGAYLERVCADGRERYVVRVTSGRHSGSTDGAQLSRDSPILDVALRAGRPTRVDDVTTETRDPGALDVIMFARVMPLRSCLVVPVRTREGVVVGTIVIAHDQPAWFSSDDEQIIADIAAHAGIMLDLARMFQAAEEELEARARAEEVQRFLGETSALLSWSLDYPETFERLAGLCVPFLADLCLIDVIEGGAIRRVAAVHADPAKRDLVAQLASRYAPDPYGAHPAASVVRGGEPEVSAEMSDDFLRRTTRDAEHFRIVKALEFRSYMCVPLTARGRTLGALTLVSAGSGRRFGTQDLAVAEEVARRSALAIDNARLYAERDFVARALQSSLLPPVLPMIPGVRFTARYRAAGEGAEVGGDFYDVFQSARRSWWLVVGDVSGKGPQAAAIAGLARHTLRAVAMQRSSPKRLLAALHETLVRGEGQGEYCTVCAGILRPSGGEGGARLVVASGGHPSPVIRRATGEVELTACSGPLLGVPLRRYRFVDQPVLLGPGDTVVMYTDGIIEAHHPNEELFGEERLRKTIGEAPDDVDGIADAILEAVREFGPEDPRDDLALLVARIEPDHGRVEDAVGTAR
jgi:PAS domain S-box-containing protein